MSIQRQVKAYKAKDPPTKHQKALPPEVFRTLLTKARTPKESARAKLISGALFYACRSCEYSVVPQKEQKTRPIRVCDVFFRIGPREIPHNSPEIWNAETVVIGFGPQKSGFYQDEIPMDASTDPLLDPRKLWADTISRIQAYPNFNPQWPIYTFYNPTRKRFEQITSKEIETDIKRAVKLVGKDKLGFGPEEVGTHSVRSSLAMQLYLQRVPPYTIMLIGRWRSDAFLTYIEKQCREFTKGMSQIMLTLDSFHQLPSQPRILHHTNDDELHDNSHHNHRQKHFVHFGRLHALRSNRSSK